MPSRLATDTKRQLALRKTVKEAAVKHIFRNDAAVTMWEDTLIALAPAYYRDSHKEEHSAVLKRGQEAVFRELEVRYHTCVLVTLPFK